MLHIDLLCFIHIAVDATGILIGNQKVERSNDKATQVTYVITTSSEENEAKEQDRGNEAASRGS